MIKRPRDLRSTPRQWWNYRQPETGQVFSHPHPKALQRMVFEHRLDRPELGLDVSSGWQERLLSDICHQDERIDCYDVDEPLKIPSVADVLRWAGSMADWALSGLKVVPQDEAERRASICLSCPYNKPIAGCFGCKGAGDVIRALTKGARTSVDERLYGCEKCSGCALVAKVHLPLEVIHADGLDLPSFCWITSSEIF